MSQQQHTSDCDVVIAGGGMVGASLALALSRYSGGAISVMVVESFPLPAAGAAPQYRPSFDARSTALSWGSRQIFDKLGIWPQLSQHLTAIEHIHVSDRGHIGSALLHAREQGWPALGYVVENAWLGSVLLSELRAAPGVSLCSPATVESIDSGADGARLGIRRGDELEQIRAQLVVVADGADSALREKLGVAVAVNDYRQAAVIANVCFDKPHRGTAYERFTDRGPLALLPLSDSEEGQARAALVWTESNADAEALVAADEGEFLRRLQQRFGYRQGRFLRAGQRASYPLRLVAANEQVRRHLVIMGNAAHSLHPVAGQGFNLALRDVARLAQLLATARREGEPLGELALLQRYAQQQDGDQRLTTGFSDRLPALFGNRHPALSLGRNLGLLALDLLPAAKARFVAQAAGVAPGTTQG